MARPSTYTDEIVDEVIRRVSDGEPLAQVCRDDHTPALRTFYDWVEARPELSARFARAREAGFDIIAHDALRIADTPVEGVTTQESDDGVKITREDMLGHRRLQVDTRLKLLAKWDPKRYGDKQAIDLGGQAGNPVAVRHAVDVSKLSPESQEALAKAARELATGGED